MARKYKLSVVGNIQLIDMLKEKISADATKIKQYEERELHYHQNTLFAMHQKQFCEELDDHSNILKKAPDAKDASEFWNNIWLIPGNFNENASGLSKVKQKIE